MAEKLYPPIIPGTLPAFYTDGTVTNITVPFSMNKAVNTNEISGFSLKVKTAYSNTFIGTLEYPKVINEQRASLDSKTFSLNQIVFKDQDIRSFNIKPGQFLKVQLAYIDNDNITGYYSTVGIIKYTDKPKLKIQELELENDSNEDDSNKIRIFCSTCTGIYTPGEEDKSERPYQYQFLLLDENDKKVENSGWLLHNNELDIGDTYTFKSKMDTFTVYKVQYNVKTINNLSESVKYKCLIPEKEKINNPLILKAENIYEEGYINLSFSKTESLEDSYIIDIYREEYGTNNQYFIHRVKINDNDISNWSFQDFTIEQGITYLYYFKYNQNGYYSQICGDENGNPIEVIADFEDMFLYDGQKQIKLRFNPKVSSFKINHLEQKIDVIGNRYPIFFRNSIVEYKEFPISGLISYHLDDNELFIQNSLQELGIQRNILERLGTNHDYDENSPFSTEQEKYFNSQFSSVKSLNLISNNIKAERLFKLKLLDWLENGEIKLFKSPSEGNYLVRLMNISLSPEDKLNRMLHTFSCTAYEAKEFNFKNLEELGFINIDQNIQVETINKNIYYLKKEKIFVGEKDTTYLSLQDKKIINFNFYKKENEEILADYVEGQPVYYYNDQPINISNSNFSSCLEKNVLYQIRVVNETTIQYYGYINNNNEFIIISPNDISNEDKDTVYFKEKDTDYVQELNFQNLNNISSLEKYKELSLGINLYFIYDDNTFIQQEQE